FFFQAEDGIRDWSVTGVQTCALPIWTTLRPGRRATRTYDVTRAGRRRPVKRTFGMAAIARRYVSAYPRASCVTLNCEATCARQRSEERRVGKEGRCRRWQRSRKKKVE